MALPMTTYSNHFSSQPLTAANLQRVVAEMADTIPTRLGIRPDTIIVPPGLIAGAIHAGHAAVARLARRLAQPVTTGRYEQRQRRRAQGVVAARAQRLRQLERDLVEAIESVEMLERLSVEQL